MGQSKINKPQTECKQWLRNALYVYCSTGKVRIKTRTNVENIKPFFRDWGNIQELFLLLKTRSQSEVVNVFANVSQRRYRTILIFSRIRCLYNVSSKNACKKEAD